MANVTLTPTASVAGGIVASTQAMATADNYICRNNGRVILHFVKTGANNATITIVTPKTVGSLAVAEQTFTVLATTGEVWAGPFLQSLYNDASGDMDISTSEDTAITIEAVQA